MPTELARLKGLWPNRALGLHYLGVLGVLGVRGLGV